MVGLRHPCGVPERQNVVGGLRDRSVARHRDGQAVFAAGSVRGAQRDDDVSGRGGQRVRPDGHGPGVGGACEHRVGGRGTGDQACSNGAGELDLPAAADAPDVQQPLYLSRPPNGRRFVRSPGGRGQLFGMDLKNRSRRRQIVGKSPMTLVGRVTKILFAAPTSF